MDSIPSRQAGQVASDFHLRACEESCHRSYRPSVGLTEDFHKKQPSLSTKWTNAACLLLAESLQTITILLNQKKSPFSSDHEGHW
jgi:hypothetical protein